MSDADHARPRAWYHTFGCKANQYDTERMRQELEISGALTVASPQTADLAVVNTCTVTSEADRDARRLIRRLHREHPGLRILVAGCSASLRAGEYEAMDEVWRVTPGQDAAAVSGAVRSLMPAPSAGDGLIELRGVRRSFLTNFSRGTRAWLKVQDGCDRRCSFCATRIARGTSRSRPPEAVTGEAMLLARSHPEIVLTGIHIGHYGQDLDEPWTLSRLCGRLLDEVPETRFRLSSIEATEIDDLLVDLMVGSGGRLVPHLHVPLQSGSDEVLKRMRRWHTRDDYRRRVLEIAERVPYLGLGADIITGFPGETESDHAATRALVDELPYTYLHVFPFSARSATAASALPDQVHGRAKAVRARELRELGLAKGRAYRASRLGGRAQVVVESPAHSLAQTRSARPGMGMSEDYLRVELPTEAGNGGRGIRSGVLVSGRLEGYPDRLQLRPRGDIAEAALREAGVSFSEAARTGPMPAS